MSCPHTLIAQAQHAIATVYTDTFRRLAHGEQIDAAEISNRVRAILRDAFDKVGACAIHKARLEIRPQDD